MNRATEHEPFISVSSDSEESCRHFVNMFFGIDLERIVRVEDTGRFIDGVPVFHVFVSEV